MKKQLCIVLLMLFSARAGAQSTLYVSPSGTTGNPGTLASPTTLQNAITHVTGGGTIYMRGGTYSYSATILIARGNDGASGALKKIMAYNSEIPVLDFSAMAESSSNRGIVLDALYWHLKGLIIQEAGDNGILLSGNNNTIESCVLRRNNDTGLQLSRYTTSYTTISQWPSNNLILNCESYDNRDSGNENADGFAAKLTCGNGNIFRGCVSHHNIDDGWDLYTKPDTGPIGVVTLENCVAHDNGILTTGGTSGSGDKNGFKLGGEDISVNHIVRRCLAFNNGQHGFTYNRNLGSIEVTNNTSYNNAERNFNFDGGTSVFKNNLSFLSGTNDRIVGTATAPNSFTGATGGFTVNSADFTTLTPGPNASPTSNGFLNLVSGSDLINAGVVTSGITYTGSAPDLGAIESGGTPPVTTYSLTTSVTGSGTVSPASGTYASGATVTLTATPATGWQFTGWGGDASGTSTSVTITVNANKTVTATFTQTSTPPPTTGGVRIEDSDSRLISYDGALKAYSNANNGYAINLSNSAGKRIVWNYSATAGSYQLTLRYTRKASMSALANIYVNGTRVTQMSLLETASAAFTTSSMTANLIAGTNVIILETVESSEFADIDWIEIAPSSSSRLGDFSTDGEEQFNVSIYPNPTRGALSLEFTLREEGLVALEVTDMEGRLVTALHEMKYKAGKNTVHVDIRSSMTGFYICHVHCAGNVLRRKIIVTP